MRDDRGRQQLAVSIDEVSRAGGDFDLKLVLLLSDGRKLVCLEYLQMHEACSHNQPQAKHNSHHEPRTPSLAGGSGDGLHGAGASSRRSIGGR